MERPTMLAQTLVRELASDLGLPTELDERTISRRVEHEGFSFLTITLPVLSDALERGLENGRLSCPSNFSKHGSLPRFLGGFFSRVFDRDGKLLDDPCVVSITAIRQIGRFYKKLKIDCTSSRKRDAVTRYKEVEAELRSMTPDIVRKDFLLDEVARHIWFQVFPEIDTADLVCHHGPGVTADRRLPNERHRIRFWYDRAEQFFPGALHAFSSYEHALGSEGGINGIDLDYLDVSSEPGVRVVFVPKTLTTPRVIAIEPSPMQYIQQSLLDYMVPRIETHKLTCRSIRFTDQAVNQDLAYRSSIDRRLATLDLKDASDRVHLELVRRIFKGTGILDYLEAARSLHATLPDGSNLVLSKFASMGSAICFPVEACVFYTLVQKAMHEHDRCLPTTHSIRVYSRRIAIYGDDIIVPVEYVGAVVRCLESYGLRVNANKSFTNSHFRESCGGDFYNGISVKPVYSRQEIPPARTTWQPSQLMSWVSTANQLYEAGWWTTAQLMRDWIEGDLQQTLPRSTVTTEGMAWSSFSFNTQMRFNSQLYAWGQRRITFRPVKRKDSIDGDAVACLNRSFLRVRERPVHDVLRSDTHSGGPVGRRDHLTDCNSMAVDFQSSVKRGAFKSKRRWVRTLS